MGRRVTIGLVVVAVVLAICVYTGTMNGGNGNRGSDLRLAMLRAAAEAINPLHQKKRKPAPGDWLAVHREPGQSFEAYVSSNPNRPDGRHTTIYVQPLGNFTPQQEKLVDATCQLLGAFYAVPVRKLQPLSLDVIPDEARRVHPWWKDKQILTGYVLHELLQPRRPEDAVAVLALTTADLWPGEGWNFVFGQADLRQRVGVWSLYRNGDPESQWLLCLRRTLKTASHETGHMLGMWHCTAYECGMNGSNHRAESDRRPMYFCPVCVQKLWWACAADPVERYRALIAFARQHNLSEEAAFWEKSLQLVRSAAGGE